MKFVKRIIPLIVILAVIMSIFMISALADDHIAKVTYYDENGNISKEVSLYTDSEVADAAKGSAEYGKTVITLASDVTVTKNIAIKEDATVYFDLAGHTLYGISADITYLFRLINPNSTLYFYSSSSGGRVYHARSSESATANGTFELSSSNVTLYLGEVIDPISNKVASGDNLSVFCSNLLDCKSTDSTETNMIAQIQGGNYVRSSGGVNSLILIRAKGAEVNLKEGVFANTAYTGTIINTTDTATDSSLNAESSLFYYPSTNSLHILGLLNEKSTFTFENCYFIGDVATISTSASCGSVYPNMINCKFSEDSKFSDEKNTAVRCYEELKINVKYNAFTYDAAANSLAASSFDVITVTDTYKFTKALTDKDCFTVTWKLGNEEKSELWLKGETPVPPLYSEFENSDASFSYDLPKILPVTANVTYEFVAQVDFKIRVNIKPDVDFVYNIYIPQSVEEELVSIKINGSEVLPCGKEVIDGEEYLLVKIPISVTSAFETFTASFYLKHASGTTLAKSVELSIPDYAERIINAGYDSDIASFISYMIGYINSVYEYIGKDASEVVESFALPEIKHIDGIKKQDIPKEIKEYLTSISLYLDDSVSFMFFFNGNRLPKSAEFIYFADGKQQNQVLSSYGDWNYYSDELIPYNRIKFNVKNLIDYFVTLKISGREFSYNLENYIYEVNNNENIKSLPNYEELKALVYNLYAYASYAVSYSDKISPVKVTIDKTDISEYEIEAKSKAEIEAAQLFAAALKEHLGAELKIVSSASTEKYIKLYVVDGENRNLNYDFKVSIDTNGTVTFRSEYESFLIGGVQNFVDDYIETIYIPTDFPLGFSKIYNTDRIYYSDFGAVGDGVLDETLLSDGTYAESAGASGTNDFEAIMEAHLVANKTRRHTVYANPGKTYYISSTKVNGIQKQIVIKTDTVWEGATFLIDDETLTSSDSMFTSNVFVIASDYDTFTISDSRATSLKDVGPSTKKIDLGLGYPALLLLYNNTHKNYIRYGSNANTGKEQVECVLVDKDGNIDPSTSIMLDYSKVTSIEVIRADVDPITLKGGLFYTVACRTDVSTLKKGDITYKGEAERALVEELGLVFYDNKPYYSDENGNKTTRASEYSVSFSKKYMERGMSIQRPNTHLIGVEHKATHEFTIEEQYRGLNGVLYRGFFYIYSANNVTLENCKLISRRNVSGGTYGISARYSNGIYFKNCIQSNYYVYLDTNGDGVTEKVTAYSKASRTGTYAYWGIGGSNYCKNMVYDSCMLSRYDAHAGVYNGKILNSQVALINLIGGGDFLIENTLIESSNVFNLRGDYGSTFKGTVTVKDCTIRTNSSPYIVKYTWSNHYFGYQTVFPNLIIDNFKVEYPDGTPRKNISVYLINTTTDASFTNSIKNGNSSGYNQSSLSPSANVQDTKLFFVTEAAAANGTYDYNINYNPAKPPEFIKIYNNPEHRLYFSTRSDYAFFRDTEITVIEK